MRRLDLCHEESVSWFSVPILEIIPILLSLGFGIKTENRSRLFLYFRNRNAKKPLFSLL